ncbi:helix-turn-helix domain-containing protein [Amycolatopsis acidicola]|uniref:Helix-turn-helix domain-containing protein n=1 Tax=Amycolatopsis acidicola TaxID=2596893 RepID=A0A5N0UV85_9PSEU|nr:helix-turn-helix domain-containing protein [Amycolatopsis acidicola]KAA9155643.1 helix-turn-helix domain-containing protein [Amycolatopsis acidicola]
MRAPHLPRTIGHASAGARNLPADALEELRRRAVAAVESGISQAQAARQLGVSRRAVGNWVRAYRSDGESAFRPRRRGRRTGEFLVLTEQQQSWLVTAIVSGPPDEQGLPYLLWTRKAVADLIHDAFGVALAGVTVDQYLSRWGFLPRSPGAPDCPQETFLVSWTRPGPPAGEGSCHALVAVNRRGLLHFHAADEPFTADVLTRFHGRLRMQLSRDVRLVVRDWPAGAAALPTGWLATS